MTLKAEFSPTVRAALEGAVERNVELINSIPSKYFGEVQEAVISSMTEGQGLKDLVPKLEKIGGITRERARFIALDQTRKAHKAASVQKMQEAGLRKFRWVHESVSAEPRAYHKDAWRADGAGGLNGGIFELSNPPVIDLGTGERGYPGDLINCRCRMEPVIELEEAEAL